MADRNFGSGGLSTQLKAKHVAWYLLAVLGYVLWFQAFFNLVSQGKLLPYDSVSEMVIHVGYNVISISLDYFAVTFVVFFLNRNRGKYTKILLDIVFSFGAMVVLGYIEIFMITYGDPSAHVDWASTIVNYIILLMINEMCYFFYSANITQRKAEKAESDALRLKYDVLKSQVNPHFLFNSLNILYQLSAIDIEKTREFILSLSKMYRYILSKQESDTVRLTEELEFLLSYIEVLQMRYHNCLFFDIQGLEHVADHTIIPYCTQMLIENVTKHNVIETDTPMTVTIAVSEQDITISNPIHPKRSAASSRIGLRYIKELYALMGKEFKYVNDGNIFTVYIPFIS